MRKMKNVKSVFSLLLVILMLFSAVPASAIVGETVDSVGSLATDIDNQGNPTGKDENYHPNKQSTYGEFVAGDELVDVYATQASTYSVVIPKTVILSGVNGIGQYSVRVSGNIAGTEEVAVVPDTGVVLEQDGKEPIVAWIEQTKDMWGYKDSGKTAIGTITAENLTAGMWSGTFRFNIYKGNFGITATDENGNDLNAAAKIILGVEQTNLISSLKESGLVDENTEIDALIEVVADDFEGLASTTFDVSGIADEGDTVVILHFNEETQQWEHIATKTVDANGNVTADFSSYSPVAFVVVKADGSFEVIETEVPELGPCEACGWEICQNPCPYCKKQHDQCEHFCWECGRYDCENPCPYCGENCQGCEHKCWNCNSYVCSHRCPVCHIIENGRHCVDHWCPITSAYNCVCKCPFCGEGGHDCPHWCYDCLDFCEDCCESCEC